MMCVEDLEKCLAHRKLSTNDNYYYEHAGQWTLELTAEIHFLTLPI